MSEAVYKKLKRQNGEAFARTIRDHHNGLLEIPDLPRILRYAGNSAEDAKGLLPYLMSLIAPEEDPAPPPEPRDPFELLDEAGYNSFYADTLEKQNSIKHHFREGELLCTFKEAARYKNYHIIHAVKKDVDQIKREDFNGKEERQDEYGTSVISIQIAKDRRFISIKNRYNHTVTGCDNTFDSNPDNIIDGLTTSLKEHFDVDFTTAESPLPRFFTFVGDQIIKYHTERGDIYYGDQFWATKGEIHPVDRGRGDALFDGFLFNNKTKELERIGTYYDDSFADTFNKYYDGNRDLIVDKNGNLTLNGDILIGTEQSRIVSLYLPEFKSMESCCLRVSDTLRTLNMPALKVMELCALSSARSLTSIHAPLLERIRPEALQETPSLTSLSLPALKHMGYRCFSQANSLITLDLPSLPHMEQYSFFNANALKNVNIPMLKTIEQHCFFNIKNLTTLRAPSLIETGISTFHKAPSLITFDTPSLKKMEQQCLHETHDLTNINIPLLEYMERECLFRAASLTKFHAPSLKAMANDCLNHSEKLVDFYAPQLMTSQHLYNCLAYAPCLRELLHNQGPSL
jgi:hypothetical protein